jgi:molybdenum cofactor cytidylyltransferase
MASANMPPEQVPDTNTTQRDEHGAAMNISLILLAAGSSSRLGQSKQMLPVDGVPLLEHAAKTALASGVKDVIVILGANEQPHLNAIQTLPVTTIANHYWKSGIGSSIKSGLNYLIRKSPDTEAVILMVCDQPSLTSQHLRNLVKAFNQTKAPIVASRYANTLGVPALFARSFFTNLLMLRDEQGAKKLIEQFQAQVKPVDFPEGSIDIDTLEDYQNYIARNQ